MSIAIFANSKADFTQYAIRNTQYAIRNTQYAIRNTQLWGAFRACQLSSSVNSPSNSSFLTRNSLKTVKNSLHKGQYIPQRGIFAFYVKITTLFQGNRAADLGQSDMDSGNSTMTGGNFKTDGHGSATPANKEYCVWYSVVGLGETPLASPKELRDSFSTKRKKDVIDFEFGDSGKTAWFAVQIENEGKKTREPYGNKASNQPIRPAVPGPYGPDN